MLINLIFLLNMVETLHIVVIQVCAFENILFLQKKGGGEISIREKIKLQLTSKTTILTFLNHSYHFRMESFGIRSEFFVL